MQLRYDGQGTYSLSFENLVGNLEDQLRYYSSASPSADGRPIANRIIADDALMQKVAILLMESTLVGSRYSSANALVFFHGNNVSQRISDMFNNTWRMLDAAPIVEDGDASVYMTVMSTRDMPPADREMLYYLNPDDNIQYFTYTVYFGAVRPMDGEAAYPTELPEGIAVDIQERGEDWAAGAFVPTPEMAASLGSRGGHAYIPFDVELGLEYQAILDTDTYTYTSESGSNLDLDIWVRADMPSLEELIERGTNAWRESLKRKIGGKQWRAAEEAEERRRRQEAREKSRNRLNTFLDKARRGEKCELIPTLPFVPHGLASSRRWGIEVESGGARGVNAPTGWTRKRDGSLRSAWAGYVEVQDFEPFDEEVEVRTDWAGCENAERHSPLTTAYSEARDEWIPVVRDDYIPVETCDSCGPRTVIVHREPQTIHHSEQSDDCAEFVSPILTSMHSNGLKELTEALSVQPQNDTAGVHVHVESNDLSSKQLNTLVYGYALIEPMIEPSYRRTRRDYCRVRPVDEVIEAARLAKEGADRRVGGDRYVSVNLQALRAHGTVEFRAMGPVYNYDHLIRWAMFCREMVNVVKAGATTKDFAKCAGNWTALMELFLKYGKEYARALTYELTGETGEWAALSKSGSTDTEALTVAANNDLESLLTEPDPGLYWAPASVPAGNIAWAELARSMQRIGVAARTITTNQVNFNLAAAV